MLSSKNSRNEICPPHHHNSNNICPERLICPFCDMRNGHATRSYNKASGKNPTRSTPSLRQDTHTFVSQYWFDYHIEKLHWKFFKRVHTNELYRGFCQCDTLVLKRPTCCTAVPDFSGLLAHLKLQYARPLEDCSTMVTHARHLPNNLLSRLQYARPLKVTVLS